MYMINIPANRYFKFIAAKIVKQTSLYFYILQLHKSVPALDERGPREKTSAVIEWAKFKDVQLEIQDSVY
jgi:hypothetical protein